MSASTRTWFRRDQEADSLTIGPGSKNPLAFRYYDADPQGAAGERMSQAHLKFAVAYWHTFKGGGQDPFGT